MIKVSSECKDVSTAVIALVTHGSGDLNEHPWTASYSACGDCAD